MTEQHGSLSINSENIFPIIKKWMYSDHDIFVRELISNGCDAITKLRKLDIMGDAELPDDYEEQIHVIYCAKKKTLKFTDNGLGMTAQEVEEYINQIAFSGATDFIEKYQGKDDEDQIIGHFGLGFYSAFMVADEVHIDTLSYAEGAEAVHWECDGGTQFSMKTGEREEVGTTITLFLNDDCLEFANAYRLREVIGKYCGFMPVPIYLIDEEETNYELVSPNKPEEPEETAETADAEETAEAAEADAEETAEEEAAEDAEEAEEAEKPKQIEPLNDIHPLWTRNPSACTDDDYKEFYRNVFHDYKEPLFWIHLNMDYPFRLKGILYFPKINLEYESAEGVIKLYNNQVFIADNIKEVIPEFLMLLKGVIDCPDLPLNVSRSALQNDGFVTKISDYITKKVADKLAGLCKTDKENYEKYWDDISPFIKYGCLKDTKFCDKMNDYILFKDINGAYQTLPELLVPVEEPQEEASEETEDTAEEPAEAAEDAQTAEESDESADNDEYEEPEDTRSVIYYVTNEQQQAQYIRLFKDQGMNAVILTHQIDSSFISQLEMRNENYRFMRIDSDITDTLTEEGDEEALQTATDTLSELFGGILENDHLTVKVQNLRDADTAAVLTVTEESQRMAEMMKMYQTYGDTSMFPTDEVLTLNAKHPLVQYVLEHTDGEHTEAFCRQLYDLAKLSNQPLSADEMSAFVARSNEIMLALAK